jgi:ubiquinone/menaquinone biosynthesis C-methylase UbiE
MNYPGWLLEIIRCPETKEPLEIEDEYLVRKDGFKYPIIDGILSLVYPHNLTGDDKKWNKFYDLFAPLYGFNERFFGKLLLGLDVRQSWKQTISYLGLKPGMRILEVSPGPGVFQPYIRELIKNKGDLVSLDLSLGMLRQCKKKQKQLNTFLIQGNGSYLPFDDNSFDALFHFGSVNLYNEPEKAVKNFVRVVKKNGIVSWGDESSSDKIPDGWKRKILTKMNPGYLKPRPPIPDSIDNVKEYEVYDGYGYLVVGTKR